MMVTLCSIIRLNPADNNPMGSKDIATTSEGETPYYLSDRLDGSKPQARDFENISYLSTGTIALATKKLGSSKSIYTRSFVDWGWASLSLMMIVK